MFTKAAIEKFFTAEKNDSLALFIIGIIAVIIGLLFLFYYKTNWHKGFAMPLLVMGIIQLWYGLYLYKTCDEYRKRNVYAYDMNRDELKVRELPRAAKINTRLMWFQYVEICLLLAGLGLFINYRNAINKQYLVGLGLAIALQALITFSFTFIQIKRVTQYTKGIKSLVDKY